jgi:hypothetical protein
MFSLTKRTKTAAPPTKPPSFDGLSLELMVDVLAHLQKPQTSTATLTPSKLMRPHGNYTVVKKPLATMFVSKKWSAATQKYLQDEILRVFTGECRHTLPKALETSFCRAYAMNLISTVAAWVAREAPHITEQTRNHCVYLGPERLKEVVYQVRLRCLDSEHGRVIAVALGRVVPHPPLTTLQRLQHVAGSWLRLAQRAAKGVEAFVYGERAQDVLARALPALPALPAPEPNLLFGRTEHVSVPPATGKSPEETTTAQNALQGEVYHALWRLHEDIV